GVGQLSLHDVERAMRLKGIDVFATGDCIHPARAIELRASLEDAEEGLFRLPGSERRFLLQTEIILSTQLTGHRNRTVAHHVLLLPSFDTIARVQALMDAWGQKNTIGRPFVVCRDQTELEDRLFALAAVHPLLEVIPAHVMTPDGVYGSRNNLSRLEEFYGAFLPHIHAIETGLSADPGMLGRIPDLHQLTFISSSDCHSAGLHRVGREFTILDASALSYPAIIEAIRDNRVALTAEFHPSEGRYYLTGHRADRTGHTEAIVFDREPPPADGRCPLCGKTMLEGVRDRCRQLSDNRLKPLPRRFVHLAPLIEVVAVSLGIRSVGSKRVLNAYERVLRPFDSEIALWQSDNVEELLDKLALSQTLNHILAVQRGQFRFEPQGYDGRYGELIIRHKRTEP
ncbi:MAG: endonuclease Q family protein, partial [Candidatus Cloacimonetes bacterium]|nr:endonuclease Q family protein [Candidatus Cloacimonadota bacterium]